MSDHTTAPNDSGAQEQSDAGPENAPTQAPAGRPDPSPPPEEHENLFDLLGPSGKQYKKPKKQPPRTGPAAAAKTPQSKTPKTFPAEAFVHYAGSGRMPLPRDGMTEDDVLAWLNETYPEISKQRAELLYDQANKMIVPVLKGHRKGASAASGAPLTVLQEVPDRGSYPPVFHVLGADGVYEVRRTQAGTFIAKIPAGLEPKEGFYPKVPKIPASLLAETLDLFRATPDLEVLVNLVYDARAASYELHVPPQQGAAGSVVSDALAESDELFTVCQVHSHGAFPAFFSAVDDEDELRTGLYGCVGRVGDPLRPTSAWRYSCGGIHRPLSPTAIFAESCPGELAKLVAF